MVDIDEALRVLEDKDVVPISAILGGRQKLSDGWSRSPFPDGGVYVVYRGLEPVYVGYTTHPLRLRLQDHMRKGTLLGEALSRGDRFCVRVIELSEEYCLEEVEVALIKMLRPEYNKGNLLPSQYTGEAKRRYEEEQHDLQLRMEELEYKDKVFNRVVNELHSHVRDAEIAARVYIMEETARLGMGEEVDICKLGEEAFRIYRQVLAGINGYK